MKNKTTKKGTPTVPANAPDPIVLQFLQDLPTKSDGFSRSILQLFEQYFQVSVSLLLLYHEEELAGPRTPSGWSYIVKNLNPDQIRPYFHEFFQSDIFSPRQPRPESVASLTDVFSEKGMAQSPYYQYLQSIGLSYQVCIFLRDGQKRLATISLFRSEADGDFTPEELACFRLLEPFITKQYLQILENNQTASLSHRFSEYFSDLTIGVALLDRDSKVLQANSAFHEYAQFIFENGTIEDDFVTRGTVDSAPEHLWAQKLINYFGAKVISQPKRIRVECLLYLFQFHTKEIYSQSLLNINAIEHQYLVFLIRQEKIRSAEILAALNLLTPREMTVTGYLASGMTNTEIAEAMAISQFTVKTHLQNIYAKCNVSGRNELLAKLK